MKTLLMAAAVLGAASVALAQSGTKRGFPTDAVKRIRIQAESGPIEVRAGDKIDVEVLENAKPELCRLTEEVQNGILLLKAESAGHGVLSKSCGAGFSVSAPAALLLDATTGSGRVSASGRSGAVNLRAGSGEIALEGVRGEAELSAGSGSISGTVSGRLTAKSGSGGVRLTWIKAPTGNVEVRSGSGNVALIFPAGTKLQARQISGSGRTLNQLGETPGAPLKVSVTTGSGDSTISAAN